MRNFLARLLVALPVLSAWAQSGDVDSAGSAQADAQPATGESEGVPDPVNAAVVVDTVPVVPLRTETEAESPTESSDATRLEDIQVTASKRLKTQRDIPGSVGALRGETLEKMNAQGMRDYLKLIPGVSLADQGSEESVPVIRGIATQLNLGFTAQTTGVYLDEMPLADLFFPSSIPDLNPFDLERVEVLKGPQGTLFGSGAMAGAVRYILHKPEPGLWQAKFSQTVSRTAEGDRISPATAAAINVPVLGDDLTLRVAGVVRRESGLYDKSAHTPAVCTGLIPECTGGGTLRDDTDADRLRQSSGRVLADWNATDELKISATYFRQRTHQNDDALADNPKQPSADRVPFPSPRDHDFDGGNLLATYDLGWGRLLSSTNLLNKHNYIDSHSESTLSLDQQNAAEAFVTYGALTRGFVQEFRLSSPEGAAGDWDWLVGASYLQSHNDWWYFLYAGPDIPDPTAPEQVTEVQKASSQLFATIDQKGVENAVFGELTRRFGEHWEATLGARGYITSMQADTLLCGATVIALFQETCHPQHFDQEVPGFNPKISLRYIHDRHFQTYVLAAKGFQFGGVQVNPPAPGYSQSAESAGFSFGPYKSSQLWNYEAGVRTEWFDRRLRFDVAAFHMDWKDLQLDIHVPYPPGTSGYFLLIANVGRAHSDGVEAALEVMPFAGVRIMSSASWIKAVTDVPFDEGNPDGPVEAGTRLPGTPRFQWSNVLSYEHPLPFFENWQYGLALTHARTDRAPDAIRPDGSVGGYQTYDVRLSLANIASRYQPELSIGVNNIADVRGVTYHAAANAVTTDERFDYYHFVPPRTVLMSLSLKYW